MRVNRRKKRGEEGCFCGKKGCCCCTVIRRRLRGGKRKKEIGINSFPKKRKKSQRRKKRSPPFYIPLDNNLVISGRGSVGSQGKKVFPSFPSFWHVPPYHITRKKAFGPSISLAKKEVDISGEKRLFIYPLPVLIPPRSLPNK